MSWKVWNSLTPPIRKLKSIKKENMMIAHHWRHQMSMELAMIWKIWVIRNVSSMNFLQTVTMEKVIMVRVLHLNWGIQCCKVEWHFMKPKRTRINILQMISYIKIRHLKLQASPSIHLEIRQKNGPKYKTLKPQIVYWISKNRTLISMELINWIWILYRNRKRNRGVKVQANLRGNLILIL